MELGLKDRVVLVTGASSGIGRAAAVAFAAEGARVALTHHQNRDAARATAQQSGLPVERVLLVPYDLGDPASVTAAVAAAAERFGGIDVLVTNAVEWSPPAWPPPAFEDLDPSAWQRTLRTSLDGVLHTIQAVLPQMRGRPGARIVLVSSGAVEYGMPGEAAYAAAKAGLQGLSRSLARELGRGGILVNIVMPGLVATERNVAMMPADMRETIAGHSSTGRLSSPSDVARAIVFLASIANGNITGEILRVSGGM